MRRKEAFDDVGQDATSKSTRTSRSTTSTSTSTSTSPSTPTSASAVKPIAAPSSLCESEGLSRSRGPRVVADASGGFAELLSRLGIEPDPGSTEAVFRLVECDGRLDLRPPGEMDRAGIRATFPPDRFTGAGAQSPLVRAFGKKTDPIFDLTAGLGGDAYRLARAGHRVFSSERDPAIYALLATGWASDCEDGRVDPAIAERLDFSWEEAASVLTRIDQANVGVYLDPMYPSPRRTRSLPKRALQVLRQLLGEAEDAGALVQAARPLAARVVVKRPHRALPLLPDVSFEVSTKLVRFDVYVNPERMEGGSS